MLQGKGCDASGTAGAADPAPAGAVPTVGTSAAGDWAPGPAVAVEPVPDVEPDPEAVKLKIPSMGWESELTTRHTTV